MATAWIRAACASHEGPRRAYNEDACAFHEDRDAALAVVADGMGAGMSGRAAADLVTSVCASVFDRRLQDYAEAWWRAEHDSAVVAWSALEAADREVIEARVREIRTTRVPATPGDLAILEREDEIITAVVRSGLVEAHRALWARTSSDTMSRGMGATAVAAVFVPGFAALAHAGDARIYRVRAGVLERLTVDHTLLEQYTDAAPRTPQEIAHYRRILVRAIGAMEELEVDTDVVATQPADVFLLCSNGISWTLEPEYLREILAHRGCEAAHVLVEEAKQVQTGGDTSGDNVTAVVVEIGSDRFSRPG